jgi:hypothetical protein
MTRGTESSREKLEEAFARPVAGKQAGRERAREGNFPTKRQEEFVEIPVFPGPMKLWVKSVGEPLPLAVGAPFQQPGSAWGRMSRQKTEASVPVVRARAKAE